MLTAFRQMQILNLNRDARGEDYQAENAAFVANVVVTGIC
jgi:hypothetical protein